MTKIDFTINGEKVMFTYDSAVVIVDFTKFNPNDKPLGGIMQASGIIVAVKGR